MKKKELLKRLERLEDAVYIPMDGVDISGIIKEVEEQIVEPSVSDEPENPVIKKSGGTHVARYYGEDYLCMDSKHTERLEDDFRCNGLGICVSLHWRPFRRARINDEVAKLRPMVIMNEVATMLVYVDSELGFTMDRNRVTAMKENTKLCTVEDL